MALACSVRSPERCAQFCGPPSSKYLGCSLSGSKIAGVSGTRRWRCSPRWRSVGSRRCCGPREPASGFRILGEDAHCNAQGLHFSLELQQIHFLLSKNFVNVSHQISPFTAVGSVKSSQGRSAAWGWLAKRQKILALRGWINPEEESDSENTPSGGVEHGICIDRANTYPNLGISKAAKLWKTVLRTSRGNKDKFTSQPLTKTCRFNRSKPRPWKAHLPDNKRSH